MTTYLLNHLLYEAAQRRPASIAVRCRDEALTYGELETQSNQFGRALIENGVQTGDQVALHLPKSAAAVVSIYSVLKTGACYVPVEAAAPVNRLESILRQCGIRYLITSGNLLPKIAPLCRPRGPLECIFVTGEIKEELSCKAIETRQIFTSESNAAFTCNANDQDLAYILFTSGSTGKPKGVMLTHLNALTFVNWAVDTFGVGNHDILSNHAPFNFDLSVFDLFAAAKAGAPVSLLPEEIALFPVRLADWMETNRITIWYSVPSALRMLTTHGDLSGHQLDSLRIILFAGEVYPVKDLRVLMNLLPGRRYANLYGPTETNVCTYFEVPPIADDQASPIPIGKACANTDVIAIGENGQRISKAGEKGVLYVRGSTVMQGYYGRPDETSTAFILNPFSPGRVEKLYCTGDWVRLDEAGNYHYLGRKDQMIKTRGYRVELEEIETVLNNHPNVQEAAVVAVPDELIGNRVIAYVVEKQAISESSLKTFCAKFLPRYMVPDRMEILSVMPRTRNDKVDRQALRTRALGAEG